MPDGADQTDAPKPQPAGDAPSLAVRDARPDLPAPADSTAQQTTNAEVFQGNTAESTSTEATANNSPFPNIPIAQKPETMPEAAKGPTVPADGIPDRPGDKPDPGRPMPEPEFAKPEPKGMRPDLENKGEEQKKSAEAVKQLAERVKGGVEQAAESVKNAGRIGSALGKAASFVHAEGAAAGILRATKSVEAHLGKLSKLAESEGGKTLGEAAEGLARLAEGVGAVQEARERGTSPVAALVSGIAQSLIPTKGAMEKIDSIADKAQAVVEKVAPRVGEYTKIVAENTPLKTAKNLVAAGIDVVDGAVRGQSDRVTANLETGKYGAIGGYAMAADVTVAFAFQDPAGAYRIGDRAAAAPGALGTAVRASDHVGNWLGERFPLPQSILHHLPF